jgi:hypothetical protein
MSHSTTAIAMVNEKGARTKGIGPFSREKESKRGRSSFIRDRFAPVALGRPSPRKVCDLPVASPIAIGFVGEGRRPQIISRCGGAAQPRGLEQSRASCRDPSAQRSRVDTFPRSRVLMLRLLSLLAASGRVLPAPLGLKMSAASFVVTAEP